MQAPQLLPADFISTKCSIDRERTVTQVKNDRDYYGSAYRYVRLLRYIVLVILVLFTVFSITVYKNDITFDNFRYLMKYVELASPGSSAGDGNISFSANSDSQFALIDGKLAIVSKKELVSYDMTGKKLLSESLSFKNPVAVENGEYLLIYDFGGNSISVFNSFSLVCEKKLDTPIDYVYLSEDGAFAVITNEKNYSGGVMAYDSNFKHIFTFMHPASRVTDVCFSGNTGLLACATTDVSGGDFLSEILVFDTKSEAEEVKSTTTVTGELPLGMFCADDNFALMTNKGIHFFDDSCNSTAFIDFGYDTPCAIYRFDDNFAVCLKSALAATDTKLLVLDHSGNKLFEEGFSAEISHVSSNGKDIFVLSPTKLSVYTTDGASITLAADIPHDGRYKKVFPNGSDRYILVSFSGSAGGKIDDKNLGANPDNT